jgi:hypothetical protein
MKEVPRQQHRKNLPLLSLSILAVVAARVGMDRDHSQIHYEWWCTGITLGSARAEAARGRPVHQRGWRMREFPDQRVRRVLASRKRTRPCRF